MKMQAKVGCGGRAALSGERQCRMPMLLARVVVYEKLRQAMELVRQICANAAGTDDKEFARNRRAMERLTLDYPLDTMRIKAEIAQLLLERERYALE